MSSSKSQCNAERMCQQFEPPRQSSSQGQKIPADKKINLPLDHDKLASSTVICLEKLRCCTDCKGPSGLLQKKRSKKIFAPPEASKYRGVHGPLQQSAPPPKSSLLRDMPAPSFPFLSDLQDSNQPLSLPIPSTPNKALAKTMESLSDTHWDVVISGTGLQQSLLAL